MICRIHRKCLVQERGIDHVQVSNLLQSSKCLRDVSGRVFSVGTRCQVDFVRQIDRELQVGMASIESWYGRDRGNTMHKCCFGLGEISKYALLHAMLTQESLERQWH